MRRSKAPSVLNKTKRLRESDDCSQPEEQYDWGSRNIKSTNLDKKRFFRVVWRDISTRKHKVWKGDGTLEVDNDLKAILKDETGKYMGILTKVDINELVPDYQMIISGKEIEIQNEIEGDEAVYNLRKTQIENCSYDEYTSAEDKSEGAKKPKGGFIFKPILVLKSPKLNAVEMTIGNEKYNSECRGSDTQNEYQLPIDKFNDIKPSLDLSLKTESYKEFICFLKPSELQQYLFRKVFDYLSFKKSDNIQIPNVELVLKMICNHPSFINHKSTTSELLRHLIPSLPDWAEMGPFDSGKLEFVQYFLTDLIESNQACIILAKNPNVLNMLQGLCDFMKIKCLRLNSNNTQNFESQTCSSKDGLIYVTLANSLETLSRSQLSTLCKKIIVFEEYLEFSAVGSVEKFKNLNIYYLVTAFSIEELLLLDTYKNVGNFLGELDVMNMENDCCYLHSKIECKCFESANKTLNTENVFVKYWNHFKTPFDLQLLQMSSLENSAENIVSIFCKGT